MWKLPSRLCVLWLLSRNVVCADAMSSRLPEQESTLTVFQTGPFSVQGQVQRPAKGKDLSGTRASDHDGTGLMGTRTCDSRGLSTNLTCVPSWL